MLISFNVDLIHWLQNAESANKTRFCLVIIIASTAVMLKEFARCVEKRSWTQKCISRPPCEVDINNSIIINFRNLRNKVKSFIYFKSLIILNFSFLEYFIWQIKINSTFKARFHRKNSFWFRFASSGKPFLPELKLYYSITSSKTKDFI